jgi:hypothetical protein
VNATTLGSWALEGVDQLADAQLAIEHAAEAIALLVGDRPQPEVVDRLGREAAALPTLLDLGSVDRSDLALEVLREREHADEAVPYLRGVLEAARCAGGHPSPTW